MKQKYLLLMIASTLQFICGQTDIDKCGILPIGANESYRSDLNWGYGYDSLLVDLQRWSSSPYVTIDSLGASVQNRSLWELTISNTPDSSALPRVYIHARTHPGEEESFWVTNEIINILIGETPLAEFIRANTIFHIIPMFNPDGVELGYDRENANGVDIESGWDDVPLEPEVAVLKSRFIELMSENNPVTVALNMHSAYVCKRYFVYHAAQGTSNQYTLFEQQFINGVQSYFPTGIEDWDYYVSWNSGTPDQYPESWWWMNHGANVMALTYEDMNCEEAGAYDSTAYAIVRGVMDYLGLEYAGIDNESLNPNQFELFPNYPNPFNGRTTISFNLYQDSHISVVIYNILGNQIKVLTNSNFTMGKYNFDWDGKNEIGMNVPSGLYVIRISTENQFKSGKILYIK